MKSSENQPLTLRLHRKTFLYQLLLLQTIHFFFQGKYSKITVFN